MTYAAVLLVVGVALAVAGALTARRPAGVLDREAYLDRWRVLHGDTDPRGNRFVHGYLRLMHLLTRPLAVRGVAPDAVTVTGVWLGALVVLLALAGDGWLVAAGGLVVVSALVDGVDGCLAVTTGRTSAHGRALDNGADRVTEGLWLAALVVAGCPLWLAVLVALAVLALEGARVVLGEVVRVTVAEKPTRVIVLAPGLAAAAVDAAAAAAAGGVLLGLTLAGLGQLVVSATGRRAAGS